MPLFIFDQVYSGEFIWCQQDQIPAFIDGFLNTTAAAGGRKGSDRHTNFLL